MEFDSIINQNPQIKTYEEFKTKVINLFESQNKIDAETLAFQTGFWGYISDSTFVDWILKLKNEQIITGSIRRNFYKYDASVSQPRDGLHSVEFEKKVIEYITLNKSVSIDTLRAAALEWGVKSDVKFLNMLKELCKKRTLANRVVIINSRVQFKTPKAKKKKLPRGTHAYCARKIRWETKKEAKEFAARKDKERNISTHVYQCEFCDGFHRTTSGKK